MTYFTPWHDSTVHKLLLTIKHINTDLDICDPGPGITRYWIKTTFSCITHPHLKVSYFWHATSVNYFVFPIINLSVIISGVTLKSVTELTNQLIKNGFGFQLRTLLFLVYAMFPRLFYPGGKHSVIAFLKMLVANNKAAKQRKPYQRRMSWLYWWWWYWWLGLVAC